MYRSRRFLLTASRTKAMNQGTDRAAIEAMGIVTFIGRAHCQCGSFTQGDAMPALVGAVGRQVLARETDKEGH